MRDSRITRHTSLLHQHLAKLQAVARRIPKRRYPHDAGNLMRISFEHRAFGCEFLLLPGKVINSKHDWRSTFFFTLAKLAQSDRGSTLSVTELAPPIHLEGLL